MPLLLVRHALAGDRATWAGDDRERPLDERGVRQAQALVEALARYPVTTILTSPAVRCVQTVEPLARSRGLPLERRPELGEDQQDEAGAALVRSLAGRDVVVCGHGGLEQTIPEAPRWKKGATLVLGPELELLETIVQR
jgi:phosphohistidine phosphatase SixA